MIHINRNARAIWLASPDFTIQQASHSNCIDTRCYKRDFMEAKIQQLVLQWLLSIDLDTIKPKVLDALHHFHHNCHTVRSSNASFIVLIPKTTAISALLEASTKSHPRCWLKAQDGKFAGCDLHFCNLSLNRTHIPLKLKFSESSRRHFSLRKGLIFPNGRKELSSYFTHQLSSDYSSIRAAAAAGETLHYGQSSSMSEDEEVSPTSIDANNFVSLQPKQKQFRNRFLHFVRLGSVFDNAAESFFKSEIRRRLFVTAILIVISRIGYFIPLPGFDRRLIPQDYLSFVSGSVDQLGDSTPELKLSLFQLGVSPQIAASILMQVLCQVLPSLVKLRKEGLDGHEKIKSYIWWISFGFAILEALILSYYSLPYSIYAANHRCTLALTCAKGKQCIRPRYARVMARLPWALKATTGAWHLRGHACNSNMAWHWHDIDTGEAQVMAWHRHGRRLGRRHDRGGVAA
ncbi:Preprotein translocase subunit SCY2, chloroplastic [Capsicum annuum]|nr:Preprotein translocase subunit SCY2, chloroplastic [Capsicum annuum]KAF3652624.1 Preprotein translocase subunit SCY2, chloroplastic [Capsicum annuum]